MQQYNVNQYPVSSLLGWVKDGEIAIPEIQRPFVWESSKVRDLMDSLYRGFPIGYIIAWKNPDVRLKDGSKAFGKKVLIDGQQRITAMRAAILGEMIINQEYAQERIRIAFNPLTEEFATLTPVIKRDSKWISDISEIMSKETALFEEVEKYCAKNPEVDRRSVEKVIAELLDIKNKQLGYIELNADLDIETVTEIFIRINSKGVILSQADFAMTKIASYGDFGVNLRKCIDYFCHLARDPKFYKQISENDEEFRKTEYLKEISWLKDENDDLYDPDYSDVVRVSFTKEFERGKMSELVGLLSGRNFETRTYEDTIQEETFQRLSTSVSDFVNQTHFKRFLMIIKSTGFIDSSMIGSKNALNFAYILYLKLRSKKVEESVIEKSVRRWFVMSVLTGRYSGSPESVFDNDIKTIAKNGVKVTLQGLEDAELSDAFWEIGLPKELDKSSINSPYLKVFFASQVKAKDEGFLSTDISVASMIEHRGDIHHLFPKDYLTKKGAVRSEYNQIANFVFAQSEINIKVGSKAPEVYMAEVQGQCDGGKLIYGNIDSVDRLKENLRAHAIPENFMNMEYENYQNFLETRRKLMAAKIRDYYFNL